MIRPLITGERGCASLVAFDDEVEWLQGCTGDAAKLELAFNKLRPGDQKSGRMTEDDSRNPQQGRGYRDDDRNSNSNKSGR